MVPEFSKLVRRATFVLLALAAVAVEVAASDGRAVLESVGLAAAWVAAAAVVGWFVPVPDDPRRKPPVWVLLFLLALAAAPFAVEPLRRDWTGDGHPLELQMVCGLRNVGLGLAACAGWLLCLRLACVVSLFLILFAAAMTNHPAVMAVLGLYTATGSVWLMLVYWAGLKSVFVAPDKAVAVEVQAGGERVPWVGLAFLVLALGGALALVVIGPKRAALSLGEWLPTSGGTGDTDPFARYGVGDGPEETAGENAKAAGMVETDRMIEDNKNSLIDAVSDMYGPPHKPPKDQEKMDAAGKVEMILNHGRLPDNRRPSRDFDTARKGPKNAKKPGSQQARGLFEVQGRTPLHVRLVAYESYDAVEKKWVEARKPGNRLFDAEGGDWMRLGHFKDAGWYLSDERHRLKAADMKSNLVPTPAMLTRFRINKVDRPEYYEWDYEGVLALAGRTRTPPGVVVTTDCRTLDPRRLPEAAFGTAGSYNGASPALTEVPEAIRPDIERLARQWAGDEPHGWPQIAAILNKLRTEYALDRGEAAPPDHPAPVLWFLTTSRRGPDYLFASAAAMLLRSLGYPARVCLGYYAAPDAYDPETAHTPVKSSDLHFWPEVRLNDGHWLVVEPTPGYDVLGPSLPLSERLLNALAALASWAWQHVVECVGLLVALVVAWICRRELIDALAVRLWAWFPGRTWREQVKGAVAILERRGRQGATASADGPLLAAGCAADAHPRGRGSRPTDPHGRVGGIRAGRAAALVRKRSSGRLPSSPRRLDAEAMARREPDPRDGSMTVTQTLTDNSQARAARHAGHIDGLRAALNRALRGKADVVERVLSCLLARGHLLLEDLPGLGKTTLAKAVAVAVGGRFSRVQCTPDLLPGDITGFSVFNQKTREFEFLPGPVFSDVLLADEINRTTPRTQSALLEAMAERQVTVDNVRHTLTPTFFVIATQNPVEHHGTYPLPEAQLDRFAMKLSVGYPDRSDELGLLAAAVGHVADAAGEGAVLANGELAALQERVSRVAVQPNVQAYLVDLGRATRAHPKVTVGLSPRGMLIWQRVAQAWAYLKDRPFVTPDDVQEVAGPVLGVRLGLAPDAAGSVIDQLLETVAVPV